MVREMKFVVEGVTDLGEVVATGALLIFGEGRGL